MEKDGEGRRRTEKDGDEERRIRLKRKVKEGTKESKEGLRRMQKDGERWRRKKKYKGMEMKGEEKRRYDKEGK